MRVVASTGWATDVMSRCYGAGEAGELMRNVRKAPTEVGAFQEIPAATYSPRGGPPSTIGAGGLDCCVRNGNRYISTAITTGNCALDLFRDQNGVWLNPPLFERPRTSTNIKLQALGRLVPVS